MVRWITASISSTSTSSSTGGVAREAAGRIAAPTPAVTRAIAVGGDVGWLVGIGFWRSTLYVVVPVMAGGVGEGAIPLSVGYAKVVGADQGRLLGQILPLAFFGNLVAIVICGALNTLGRRHPDLTCNGQRQPGSGGTDGRTDEVGSHDAAHGNTTHIDVATIAASGITRIAIYVFATLIHAVAGLPSPVAMLFLVVLVRVVDGVPAPLAEGARVVFRFFVVAVTDPLLFCTAVALTPWHKLVEAFHPANLVTIVATVIALVATGD